MALLQGQSPNLSDYTVSLCKVFTYLDKINTINDFTKLYMYHILSVSESVLPIDQKINIFTYL